MGEVVFAESAATIQTSQCTSKVGLGNREIAWRLVGALGCGFPLLNLLADRKFLEDAKKFLCSIGFASVDASTPFWGCCQAQS